MSAERERETHFQTRLKVIASLFLSLYKIHSKKNLLSLLTPSVYSPAYFGFLHGGNKLIISMEIA